MKKRFLVGLPAAALSLSLLAGALTHLSTRKDIAEVKADGAYCCINDYNLVDHLGEPYTPDGGSGTITLSHDTTNSVYTLALDNFVYKGAGVEREDTWGGLVQIDDANVLLYIAGLNEPVKVTLKGESSIVLNRNTTNVRGLKTIYSTEALDFQTAEGESEKATFTVGLESSAIVLTSRYYSFACKSDVTVANCEINTYMTATATRSVGFQVGKNLTINEGAKMDLQCGIGGGSESNLSGTTAGLWVDGTFTVNAGEVKAKSGNVFSGQYQTTAYSYGARIENAVINGGDVNFESGDVNDGWGAYCTGTYINKFTMNGGKFVSRGATNAANNRNKLFAYGMMGSTGNATVQINDCPLFFEVSAYGPNAKEQLAVQYLKVVNEIEGSTYYAANPDTPTVLETSDVARSIPNAFKLVFIGQLNTHLWIGGVKVTEEGCINDDWQYDYNEKVLTLSGYEYEGEIPLINLKSYYGYGVIYYNGTEKLTINVTGENSITVTSNDHDGNNGYGVETLNSDLEFTGTGSLTVTAANAVSSVAGVGFDHDAHILTFGGSGSYTFNTEFVFYGPYSSNASVVLGENVKIEATAISAVFYQMSSFVWAQECAFWTNAAATEGRLCLKVDDELPDGFYTSIYLHFTYPFTPHIHDLSYTADGATITATCAAEDCDLENNQATLTLEAPANLVYDGAAKAATFTAGYNTEVFPDPKIKYYQAGVEVASCVNAGKYTAKVTFGSATAELEFTIAKADLNPAPDAVPDQNATYGQTLSQISLPSGWAWNSPNDKVGDAGTNQHKATYTPDDADNYNAVEQNVTVNVAKADPEYTVPTGLTALINKTLSTVALPTGWAWDNPNENVGAVVGNKTFKATFTPSDTKNYNLVEHVDVTVLVTEHEHNWGYTASGATITASCSAPDCPTTEGLTLTLEAPKGELHYDGTAKVATLKAGYSADAFPNPVIKYFRDGAEVSECVNVGKYATKVTFGNAVAMVEFEILGKTMSDPDNPGATIEIDDAVVADNIELRVEVRTDVAEKETAADYEKIQKMLGKDEQISKVYDVKLIQTVGGVEKVIQPSDIKPGLKITVRMAIPEGVDMANARILHIHSVDDMEFVTDYKADGSELVFEVGKLSQFAFVTKANIAPAHGFCVGWVAMILDILFALCAALYIVLRLKPFKLPQKVDVFGEKVTSKEVTLTLAACLALFANFIFDLIVLIVHQCPVSIVAFILGLLMFAGIAFWYVFTRKQGKRTPIEEKVLAKFKK